MVRRMVLVMSWRINWFHFAQFWHCLKASEIKFWSWCLVGSHYWCNSDCGCSWVIILLKDIRVGSIMKHSLLFYWPKSLYGLGCSLKSINYVECISQPYKILNMGGSSVTSNPMEYQDQANSSFGIHQCLSKQNCSIHFLCFQIHPKRQKKLLLDFFPENSSGLWSRI